MQGAVTDAALAGRAQCTKALLEKHRDYMDSEDGVNLGEKLCMAVITKAAASDEEDEGLKNVLEVFLADGYPLTQAMLTTCLKAPPFSCNARRAAFLRDNVNKVAFFHLFKACHG